MDNPKLSVSIPALLFGALLSFFVMGLSLLFVILFFGEAGNASGALLAVLLIALSGLVGYLVGEVYFYRHVSDKSTFALSYFLSLSLLLFFFFLWLNGADLSFVFDDKTAVKAVLAGACFRLCTVNAVALVLRIGWDVFQYARRVAGK
jgi:hypothetical protein